MGGSKGGKEWWFGALLEGFNQSKVEGSGKNYIDAIINKNTETKWRLTSFYWEPEIARRIDAWDIVRNLNSRLDSPWLCCGDFNEIIK